jgi:hypothetical protein
MTATELLWTVSTFLFGGVSLYHVFRHARAVMLRSRDHPVPKDTRPPYAFSYPILATFACFSLDDGWVKTVGIVLLGIVLIGGLALVLAVKFSSRPSAADSEVAD